MADQLTLEVNPPEAVQSEEPTRSAPQKGRQDQESKQDQEDIQLLLDAVQREFDSYAMEFRSLVARTLEAYEFLKGNHFFDFWAGTTDMFSSFQQAMDYIGGSSDGSKEDEDLSLSDLPTNIYQMLFFGYQATLSADMPRNTVTPESADESEDRETATAGTTVMTIIAKKNNARELHLKKLFQFWCSGHYWEYTRYVVDAERYKTHKETVLKVSKQQVVPDRMVCTNCGAATPLSAVQAEDDAVCPKCGAPIGPQNVFPGYVDNVPVAEQQADIPNGMVTKDIYGPHHVMFKPKATKVSETPLRLQMEVSVGWLRDTFPDYYDDIREGMGADGSEEQQQRQARQIGMSVIAPGYVQTTLSQDPTYTRDFVPEWLYSNIDNKAVAQRLKKKYPGGVMIAHLGRNLILSKQKVAISECWTHAATCKDVGLAGIPAGQSALPLQKRFNNLTYMVDDFFERMAAGLVLANAEYIDTKALNRKGLLPGVFNPVAFRKQSPLRLADLVHQFIFEIEPELLRYLSELPGLMQQLTGVMPQIIGGDPGNNVQTAAGQQQQYNTAKGRLNLNWNQIRGQDAEAAEQGVSCAGKNMTDKWWTTVTDKTGEFRNEYVHPDQMKGSVHVEPEEDQGFPLTAEQIQAFWEKVLSSTDKMVASMLFSEPKNVDACIRSFGVKGIIAPGSKSEARALHLIDLLMQGDPQVEQVPIKDAAGQPAVNPDGSPVLQQVDVPSVSPVMFIDDLPELLKIVPDWAIEHFDKWESNDAGKRNLVAFIKLCMEMQFQKQQVMAKAMGPPPGAMPPPGKGAPKQLPAGQNQ